MGCIVSLAILLCFLILLMLAVLFGGGPRGQHLNGDGALGVLIFFVIPVYYLLKSQLKDEREAKVQRRQQADRQRYEASRAEENRLLDEMHQLQRREREREELARREWEQTPDGQAFLEQKRREAEQKERAETERRERLVKEEEEKIRAELERRKKEAEKWAREEWRRWHESKTLAEIAEMSGLEFEAFLLRLLTQMGYAIQPTPINDQGGDLVGNCPKGVRTVVQAKRWKDKLGNSVVQELLGAMLHYDAAAGMVITNSSFTTPARQLAGKDKRITLCDGRWLETQIRKFLPQDIPEFDWTKYNELAAQAKQFNAPPTSNSESSSRRRNKEVPPQYKSHRPFESRFDHCPNCGLPNPLPDSRVAIVCKGCGRFIPAKRGKP